MTSDFRITSVRFFLFWVELYQIQQDALLKFSISAAACCVFFSYSNDLEISLSGNSQAMAKYMSWIKQIALLQTY